MIERSIVQDITQDITSVSINTYCLLCDLSAIPFQLKEDMKELKNSMETALKAFKSIHGGTKSIDQSQAISETHHLLVSTSVSPIPTERTNPVSYMSYPTMLRPNLSETGYHLPTSVAPLYAGRSNIVSNVGYNGMLKPICSPRTGDHLSTSVTPTYTGKADSISITSHPNRLEPIPSPIMSAHHTPMATYHMGNSDQHSSSFASSALDFLDSADDYVPPLPQPIITSSFSSNYEDNSKDEDSSSESGGSLIVSRSPLRQNNQKRIKRKSQKADEKIYPITEVFNPLFLEEKKKESSSRQNFAAVLVRSFFKREVRMTSNVAGKSGKNQLCREMMAAIKVATFRMWPLESSEGEKQAWRLCRRAIDEAGRRLYRSRGSSKENRRS